MNVNELSNLLGQAPQDIEVWVEGCDCVGKAVGVDFDSDGLTVIRKDGVSAGERGPDTLLAEGVEL